MDTTKPTEDQELARTRLYEKEKELAQRARNMLEEHLEYRRNLRVYTPKDDPREDWIWGLGPDYTRPYRGPRPYKMDAWIETVFADPDEKIHLYWGWADVSDTILEEHPKVYRRLVKEGDDPEKKFEELFKVLKELQFKENWKKYEDMFPKVVRTFRKCEKLAKDVSQRHNTCVEFWINERHWGIQATVNAKGMDEDEKLKAIMNASTALKDFNERLLSK